MKKICLLVFYSLFFIHYVFAQGGTWTWISGSNQVNAATVFGTQGVPSVSNHPPSAYEPAEWKDKQGNFWIYGGYNDTTTYSDLWEYNALSNEWTWVQGNGLTNQQPVYGTKLVPNYSNSPGQRPLAAATWVDTSGALWLFGGLNCSNDLWMYDISSNQWTWMKGDSTPNAAGVHGTQGIASSLNTPGSRDETCSAWTDSLNNLWLFGGVGYDENGGNGILNDLMKYNISSNEWTWLKGSIYTSAFADYGAKGLSNINNDPGARFTYTKWKDMNGDFWLMGGFDGSNTYNDIWKFDLSVNEWTWMSGTNAADDPGNYQSECVSDTINLPYSRYEQRSSVTDNCGRFWLFGGAAGFATYYFNDLWFFDPFQLKWKWISGPNAPDQPGSYGNIGMPSLSNLPPSRWGAVAWWGNDNRFYMFGGSQFDDIDCYADLWVFNPDTNCIPPSSCNSVVVLPPVADFQSSANMLCANDCINFTDLSMNATSWLWKFAGAIDSISTSQNPQNVCYPAAGNYNVTLIAFNLGGSDSITFSNYIVVNAAPPTPLIEQMNDTLYCSANPVYTGYQWYLDTTSIPGATDTFLVITHGGNYNMQVTNGNGCKIAVGINIVLGLQNYVSTVGTRFTLSPNPVKNSLQLKYNSLQIGKQKIGIYNVLGQVFDQFEIINRKSEIAVDVSAFPAGIYFVHLVDENGEWIGRFVKE